eukprot:scaffold1178_cov252-Pinguiococcus_pyrenoidosus.AAC.33
MLSVAPRLSPGLVASICSMGFAAIAWFTLAIICGMFPFIMSSWLVGRTRFWALLVAGRLTAGATAGAGALRLPVVVIFPALSLGVSASFFTPCAIRGVVASCEEGVSSRLRSSMVATAQPHRRSRHLGLVRRYAVRDLRLASIDAWAKDATGPLAKTCGDLRALTDGDELLSEKLVASLQTRLLFPKGIQSVTQLERVRLQSGELLLQALYTQGQVRIVNSSHHFKQTDRENVRAPEWYCGELASFEFWKTRQSEALGIVMHRDARTCKVFSSCDASFSEPVMMGLQGVAENRDENLIPGRQTPSADTSSPQESAGKNGDCKQNKIYDGFSSVTVCAMCEAEE